MPIFVGCGVCAIFTISKHLQTVGVNKYNIRFQYFNNTHKLEMSNTCLSNDAKQHRHTYQHLSETPQNNTYNSMSVLVMRNISKLLQFRNRVCQILKHQIQSFPTFPTLKFSSCCFSHTTMSTKY